MTSSVDLILFDYRSELKPTLNESLKQNNKAEQKREVKMYDDAERKN